MLDTDAVGDLVHRKIAELLEEIGAGQAEITGTDTLNDLGLSSLMLARLIIQVETEVGIDPFGADLVISDVRTVNELVAAYQNALSARSVR